LLLRFSAAAAQGTDAAALIRLFCRETREFFQLTGVYFWQSSRPMSWWVRKLTAGWPIRSSDCARRRSTPGFWGGGSQAAHHLRQFLDPRAILALRNSTRDR